jgi:maleylacetoacetate isomerase
MRTVLRVHRIPFSTNVERVALAAGHKGLDIDWVDHEPADRSAIVALSGQELVPVAEIGGEVVVDSMVIVARLEELAPERPLYPAERCRRAGVDVFVEWFNHVWKGPPNAIADELEKARPDQAVIDAHGARMRSWLDLFENLLDEPDHLLGPEFSAADVCAFPFLKYALLREPDDDELFHRVLEDHMPLGDGYPRLREWIARIDERPRA